jgi:hypothetical protein
MMHFVNYLFGEKTSRICYLDLTYILHTVDVVHGSWGLFPLEFEWLFERFCHIAKYLGYSLLKDETLLWSPEELGRQRG